MQTTFTILHINDLHSNLIGVGPASEYSPATVNDDMTIGGIERIATLIALRRKAREIEGPVEPYVKPRPVVLPPPASAPSTPEPVAPQAPPAEAP